MEIFKCNKCDLKCILISKYFPTYCPFGYTNADWIKLDGKYKRCIKCGNEFKFKYEEQSYCSDICEENDYRERSK